MAGNHRCPTNSLRRAISGLSRLTTTERGCPSMAKRRRITRWPRGCRVCCSTNRPVTPSPPSNSSSNWRNSSRPACPLPSRHLSSPSIILAPVDRAQRRRHLRFIRSDRHDGLEQKLVGLALHGDRFPEDFVHYPQQAPVLRQPLDVPQLQLRKILAQHRAIGLEVRTDAAPQKLRHIGR